ncbi:MAG TPA: DUF983 domain-containing protein [Pirellulales bacterium]|nr:DUF983 domain-containing protein [Pirellulales bacterium]
MSLPNSTLPPDDPIRQPAADACAPTGKNIDSAAGVHPAAASSLVTLLWRAVRLRCPVCGQGKLFRGWFTMYPRCEQCHFRFERSPGYWLGSIFVNYGLTALIVTAAYFALFFTEALPPDWIMRLLLAFCLLFPLWFFRYARGIWISVDLYFDPEPATKLVSAKKAETSASSPPQV